MGSPGAPGGTIKNNSFSMFSNVLKEFGVPESGVGSFPRHAFRCHEIPQGTPGAPGGVFQKSPWGAPGGFSAGRDGRAGQIPPRFFLYYFPEGASGCPRGFPGAPWGYVHDGPAPLRAPGQNNQSNHQIGKFQGKPKKQSKTMKKQPKTIKNNQKTTQNPHWGRAREARAPQM